MRMLRALVPVLLATLPVLGQVKHFRVDTNHTVLGFKAVTPLFDVPGRFTRYKADIKGDPATLEGVSIRLDIEARSIDTGNRLRDDHLRTPDFFDAARYPRITFQGDRARREGDRILVQGTLSMHGVSRELEIPFTAAEGRNGADVATWSYRATLPLDRLAYGLGAESVAARISLKREVELSVLLVGFFE
ncbi:MAG TPA: YceI family protein [Holophaga sp.]|nr:YceI family protein [Holophaga sp.]